jgi:hypothetical protein
MSGNRFQQQIQAAAKKHRAARDIAPAIAAVGQGQMPAGSHGRYRRLRWRLAPLLDRYFLQSAL